MLFATDINLLMNHANVINDDFFFFNCLHGLTDTIQEAELLKHSALLITLCSIFFILCRRYNVYTFNFFDSSLFSYYFSLKK